VAWAARSAGQSVPDRVSAHEVVPVFDLARLSAEKTVLAAHELTHLRAR
jgi:hypothetical protein